jgi:hypothetical protein
MFHGNHTGSSVHDTFHNLNHLSDTRHHTTVPAHVNDLTRNFSSATISTMNDGVDLSDRGHCHSLYQGHSQSQGRGVSHDSELFGNTEKSPFHEQDHHDAAYGRYYQHREKGELEDMAWEYNKEHLGPFSPDHQDRGGRLPPFEYLTDRQNEPSLVWAAIQGEQKRQMTYKIFRVTGLDYSIIQNRCEYLMHETMRYALSGNDKKMITAVSLGMLFPNEHDIAVGPTWTRNVSLEESETIVTGMSSVTGHNQDLIRSHLNQISLTNVQARVILHASAEGRKAIARHIGLL